MTTNDHIINKQLFEFECVHSEHAFQLQNKFDHDVQYKINRIIERACNRLAAGEEDIRIPVLEIDLGKISFNRLESEILLEFEKQFYQKLLDQKERLKAGSYFTHPKQTSLDILKFFLRFGQLPWFSGKKSINIIDELFEDVFSRNADEFRKFVLLNLDNEKFIERLIALNQTYYIDVLIRTLGISDELIMYAESLIKDIAGEIVLKIRRSDQKENVYHQLIIKPGVPVIYSNDLVKILIATQQQEISPALYQKLALEIILKMMSVRKDISTNENFYAFFYKMIAEKMEAGAAEVMALNTGTPTDTMRLSNAADIARKTKQEIATLVGEQLAEPEQEEGGLKFYISNAGLILIATYLPEFFDRLGLLEKGDFVRKSDQVRAVFILHYLCMGTEEAPEYILPLNKILCGLSLEEPLPLVMAITETEKQECEELLQEVIVNWQKPGSLSTDGLRESFLVRDAILSAENKGWKLTVERRGYDVLLDSMPWSFSHIKLSWMQELITIEW